MSVSVPAPLYLSGRYAPVPDEIEAFDLVLDASILTRVAAVSLPRGVPAGFHGSWLPE